MSIDPGHDRVPRRSFALWARISVAAALIFGALTGFVVLPVVQGAQSGVGAWAAICRAIGIAPGSPAAQPVSQVSWAPGIINALHRANREEGKKLASETCVACHGESGISEDPQWPHLSGQSAFAIYKQLHDFSSGARENEQMTPMAQQLSEQQMTDVTAFYSHFLRGTLDPQLPKVAYTAARRLIEKGDTARALPACNACHGGRAGGPIETPTLTGQRREYLERQLQAYASGTRKNDVYRRMRTIAAKLRPEEIAAVAEYYASAKPPGRESR
jgi:cytochrome c553